MSDDLHVIKVVVPLEDIQIDPSNNSFVVFMPGIEDHEAVEIDGEVTVEDINGKTEVAVVQYRMIGTALEIFNRYGPIHYLTRNVPYSLNTIVDRLRKTYKGPRDFDITRMYSALVLVRKG